MKKLVSLAVCLLPCAGPSCRLRRHAGAEIKGEVNLYTWEGMFPQEVLDAFTAETGYQVNYSSFDTDETMLARLEAAEGGDYDVVIADDYIIETAIAQGLVSELDKNKTFQHWQRKPHLSGPVLRPAGCLHRALWRRRANHCI